MRAPLTVLPLLVLGACRAVHPSGLPSGEPWLVAVKSAGIPSYMPWYSHFAEHTWLDIKGGSEERWLRVEVSGASSGARCSGISAATARRDFRWSDEAVRVHAVIAGEPARRIASQIEALTQRLDPRYANGNYEAWPGPNSNTFLRDLARELPELAFVFDHNAVGKDYAWFAAGLTPSRTGVQLDTWPVGLALGAREGLELHLLQLTLAVRFWPPQLALPGLPAIPWERAPDDVQALAAADPQSEGDVAGPER